MKKFIIELLFLSLIISFSCNRQDARNILIINSFPKEQNIIGESHEIFISPQFMGICDTLLFIINNKKENIVNVFNSTNLSFIGSFGNRGKGPNEYMSAQFYGQYTIDNKGINVWIMDGNSRKLHLINVEESLKTNNSTQPIKEKFLTRNTGFERSVFYINDSLIIGSSQSSNGHLYLYNPILDEIKWTKFYPELETENEETFGLLWLDMNSLKPDGSKIACAFYSFNRIDIYSTDGKFEFSVTYNPDNLPEIIPKEELVDSDQNKVFYLDVYSTNNYIYALYCNSTSDNLYNSDFKSEIHVFNWNGDPVSIYRSDIAFDRIVVDEKNKIIIGGHYITDGDITVFNLDSLF